MSAVRLKRAPLAYRKTKKPLKILGFDMLPLYIRVERDSMPVNQVPTRGYLLWWTGVCRIHEDGDGWSAVFRAWHPITWLIFLVMIPVCALVGEPIFDVVPMRISSYFREHPEQLVWWSPFSDRQGLVCPLKTRKSA